MPSPPVASNSHSSAGELTPPGKRQLIDTTAIGSSSTAVTVVVSGVAVLSERAPSSVVCR